MGFAEKEQKRKSKSVVSAIAGVGLEEQIPGQIDINVLDDGKYMPSRGKGRPKVERETKERKTLALYPSIYDDVGKIAYVDRTSVSKIVCNLLQDYVSKNKEKLVEYERLNK